MLCVSYEATVCLAKYNCCVFFVYHHYIQCDSIGVLGKKQKPFVLHHGKPAFCFFYYVYLFIYLLLNYPLYETTQFTVKCMKWCEWKQENLYLWYCPYEASVTHTLMLNRLNDYNRVLHKRGIFLYTQLHLFERTVQSLFLPQVLWYGPML